MNTGDTKLGARIRSRRIALKLSQRALARLVKVTRESISNYETGRVNPTLGTLKKLAKALMMDTASLLG